MKKRMFVATVSIAIEVPTNEGQSYACDAISAILSENLMENGLILDWSYLKLGNTHIPPHEQIASKNYKESDFLS